MGFARGLRLPAVKRWPRLASMIKAIRNNFRWVLPSLTAAFGSVQSALPATPAVARRPNVLWIMCDQLRFDCIGANGNHIIKTPNLDRLAAASANFSRAFVQAPVCVPSRVSYFTGRYPHSHRNRVNYTPLAATETLLPARLKAADYNTALIGKTHIYYRYPPTGEEVRRTGFDRVDLHDGVPFTDQWSDYAQWRKMHDPLHELAYRRLARSVPEIRATLPTNSNPYRAAIDAQFTDTAWTGLRTRERLKELAASQRPFFLFSSFWKPHEPYEVPAPYDTMYNNVEIPLPKVETQESIERLPVPLQKLLLRNKTPAYLMDHRMLQWAYRSYYGTVSHLDHEIGLILEMLQQLELAENTIVVFNSDHGDQLLEHGEFGKNCFYEASVRVPMMFRFPGRIRPSRYDALIESVDVMPTLFELINLPLPKDCQGQSLVALCDGAGRPYAARDAVFSENVIPEVITGGNMDYTFEKGIGIKGILHPDAKMVRTSRWKYNYYPNGGAELYDLQNDPQEQINLAADPDHKTVVDDLKQKLLNWLIIADEADQIAPRWVIP